jgi:hypothetical protein
MWPHERSLVKNLENKPFALIGVHIGADTKTLKGVVDREKLNWRSFVDDPVEISLKWNVSGTPNLFLIDHQGVIRHKWKGYPGARAIDTALEKLIQDPLKPPK